MLEVWITAESSSRTFPVLCALEPVPLAPETLNGLLDFGVSVQVEVTIPRHGLVLRIPRDQQKFAFFRGGIF